MNIYKLPIHLIRQYLFCPRVVYFLEVLNIPKSSPIWVKEGEYHHKKQLDLFKRRTLKRFNIEDAKLKTNVSLSSQTYNFYGISDGILESQNEIFIVEIKLHGKAPTPPQVMQVTAYGILASEIFNKEFNIGFVVYESNGKTVPIKVTKDLKQKVLKIVDECIKMIEVGKLPHSSADEHKCTQCEFLNYCNDRF